MSIIKLEIDSTDSIVCGAFAVAFQTLAGGVMQEKEPKPTLTSGSIKEELEKEPILDLPHDSRIHSSGKVKNQDGTWKYARKPKDKTPDEWKEYIAQVESELEQLMSIPVPEPEEMEKLVEEAEKEVEASTPTINAGPKPPVDKPTPPVDKEELQEAIEKVKELEEPKPKPPVAPPAETTTSVTFAEIMKVAVKCGVTNANAIVAEMGVPEPYMPNLKKREDLFPAAYAALVEAIGA